MTQFDDIKAAMCGAFCVCDLNCPYCKLKKVTPETAGDYRLKDLFRMPLAEQLGL